ncbi:hypothetical protein LCGC14_2420860 [marine sediment metagenome]|uniref:Transcriptional coactivator p15 (PC4) C-terminal domain-containing protein n=1 Tax=marine sediment metagenome TaxID=412755 RepID=A0A0F9CBX9_9ZZZZ
MSTKTLAREIKNGNDGKLVVSAGTWRKKGYVDIRNYWRSPDGEWHPTKRGVRVDQHEAVHIACVIHNLIGELWPVEPKQEPDKRRNGSKTRRYKPPTRPTPDVATVGGGQWLVPGKDHRRTPGKASFGGKGLALVCKSVAYWGRPIHRPLTLQELAACTALTQTAQHIGRIICRGDPPSGQEIRPALLMPSWIRHVARFGAKMYA